MPRCNGGGLSGTAPAPAWGQAPAIPEAKPQGALPTLKMPTARGWSEGQKPTVAPGLKVNAFATGLDHPRWIEVLPNGDVLIAEATQIAGAPRSVFHYAMQATMRRAAALGVSANRITLLRDKDGDGVAEVRGAFMENLSQPFGMALVGNTFYVGNTDGVMAFPYVANADRITAPGQAAHDVQAERPLDAQPARKPRRQEALCRCRLAQQHRRDGHGGRGRPRRGL
ncbi:glucose/arabinose dehydrogenase [Bradyrhizobium sp. i1.4.4]